MITYRFVENQYYDAFRDEEVVRLMAITNKGTWHCEVPADNSASLRANRHMFREYVLQAMKMNQEPQEVTLG